MSPTFVIMARADDSTGDFDPNDNVGPLLMGITGFLTAMIVITTGLRLYVRAMLRVLGWDDWTMLLTTVLALFRMAVQAVQVKHGNGRHQVFLETKDVQTSNMYGWIAQLLLFSAVCTLKVSIILLILRIKDDRNLKIFLWAVIGGLVVTNFGVVIILLAECDPVDAYWMGTQKENCWPTKVRIYAIYLTIAYSVLTDILCSFLPIVVVWKVRIPTKTKFAVGTLMSLGLIATGFGIARAASLGITSSDLTWVYAIAAIWSNLELFLGIVAANMALTRSIYVYLRYGKEVPSSQSGTYGKSGSQSGYINNSSLRPDRIDPPATLVAGSRRRPSASHSDNSDIPLEPGVLKKTEFWLSEEEGSQKESSSQNSR